MLRRSQIGCWLQKSVLVYEIYDDGAIAKDDRLLCGDQILEVRPFTDSSIMAVWLSANIVGLISKVTLRRAGLVLRWVTICRYTVLVLNKKG